MFTHNKLVGSTRTILILVVDEPDLIFRFDASNLDPKILPRTKNINFCSVVEPSYESEIIRIEAAKINKIYFLPQLRHNY